MSAWHAAPDGIALRVKAQPRARRAGVGGIAPGIDGPSLRVAVTEAPEDGRASEAVRTALAKALSVAPSAVALRQGVSSRQKLFHVAGDAGALIARLEALA